MGRDLVRHPVPVRCYSDNPLNPSMSFLTINASTRRDRQRLFLVACLLVVTALLQVHPSVIALLRILPESPGISGMVEVDYGAHLVVYLVLTLLVLIGMRPERGAHDVTIVSALLFHGVMTELVQYWLPGGQWNLLEMASNLSAVLVAASIYILWSCRTPFIDRNRRRRQDGRTPRPARLRVGLIASDRCCFHENYPHQRLSS